MAGALKPARRISVLGATGSIGASVLDVIARHPQRFQVEALVAGSNVGALLELCARFQPRIAAIADESALPQLRDGLSALGLATQACGRRSSGTVR